MGINGYILLSNTEEGKRLRAKFAASKKEREMKLKGYETDTVPKARDIGRIVVTGFGIEHNYEDIESALNKLFASCGKITDVYANVYSLRAYVYFVGEGAVDKALLLDGTDVGGWKVSVKAYPFHDNNPVVMCVEGFSSKLLDDEVKTAMFDLFSSCEQVTKVEVIKKSRSDEKFASVIIKGIEACEKALELNGSYIGTKKVRVVNLSKPPRFTRHSRRISVCALRPSPLHI